jgi:outer membrane protein assembly factor BamB/protein-L-isoaspartate O-methyltransferase
LGSQAFGDPVVAAGQVWIGTNNFTTLNAVVDASVLAGFSTADGKPLYRYLSSRLPQGRSNDWPYSSIACSPLIEGDRMWFTTNRCETICLDIGPLKRGEAKPREVWKIDMMKQFGVFPCGSRMALCHFCSIAAHQELIYVITGNGMDLDGAVKPPAPQAPSVICFKKDSGEVVWQDNSPGENILEGQWSSPLVIENRAQVVVPQGDGWLRSFDAPTGKLIWKFDINPKTAKWDFTGRSNRNTIMATPVYYDGHVYVANGRYAEHGSGPGRLVCIDPTKTGDISSELAIDAAGQPVPENRIQAVDTGKGQRAVPNPNSGLVWEYTQSDRNGNGKIDFEEQFHRTYGNVAIKNDLPMAGDFSGLIHCLDAKTGKVYWTYDCRAAIYASPLIVEDKVYVADEDGMVRIFRLAREPQQPLAEIDMDTAIYAAPIFSNGTLYIASQHALFAIAGDQPAPAAKPLAPATTSTGSNRTPRAAFSPTPHDIVEKMLELAKIKKADVVCDLGSGDGRIVIAAAKRYGSRAIGYETDKELIESSRVQAEAAGVKSLVTFEHQDLFTADLHDTDVIAVYLLPEQLEQLIPQFEKLKPGARIVSHHFEIPGIKADEAITTESQEDGEKHSLFLYTAPLRKTGPASPKVK